MSRSVKDQKTALPNPMWQTKAYMESEHIVDHSQGGRLSPQNRTGTGQRKDSGGTHCLPILPPSWPWDSEGT